MLTKMDDYPIHQTPYPLSRAATTDRHLYHRYWFNGYDADGALYFGACLALYPHLGVMDCAFSLVVDGEQHSFIASRRAPLEPTELQVGPFRIEIIEPMMSLRIVLEDNLTGLSCDLTWIPRTANIQERHQDARGGGRFMQATRFNQFGFWSGRISHSGRSIDIRQGHVFGTKDRSWGVRPVGDPAPIGAPPAAEDQWRMHFLWLPVHWSDRCTHLCQFENIRGEVWHFDGMVSPTYAGPADIPGIEDPAVRTLAATEYQIRFKPGTRRAINAEFTLVGHGGERERLQVEPLLCFRMKGIGYNRSDWSHGMWKGELAMHGETKRCSDMDNGDIENGHIQQVVRVTSGAHQGTGVLEQIHLGPHPVFGFKRTFDPA